MKRTVALIILDGWGIGAQNESNPIHVATLKTFEYLEAHYPLTSLQASGISVGLPWGEVGNSEVGHLTIGAGKVLYQHYPRITLAIQDGSFFRNAALMAAYAHAKKNGAAVHAVGLLSRGNVHASLEHLLALIEMARREEVPITLQLWSDGKDSPPYTLQKFLSELPVGNLGSITGRFYAMDREHNWQLTEKAYRAMVGEAGAAVAPEELDTVIARHYEQGMNEEFLPPLRIGSENHIKDGDAVILFNFREDSMRQMGEAFLAKDFSRFPRKPLRDLLVVTMTRYREDFVAPVAFPPETVERPLGAVLSEAGKSQLRIAETYKYAHVTYFFNGYREAPYPEEYRVLIPSLNATHIEAHPQMMAQALTDRVLQAMEGGAFDFILTNYANGDAIAHTGNYQAALEAVQVIDQEVGRLLRHAEASGATLVITADHGNIEEVINPLTARPETQHDPSPVPLYLVGREFQGRKFTNYKNLMQTSGILSDVAPTVLELMGLPKPEEMTGISLLRNLVV
jgi:2,3-bisphosphoglycerate-independent phosphoglycerate mutase